MAGLRLMVMRVNENRVLCTLQANRKTDCDEMETVHRGLNDIKALQDYVDAQAGGPGKGFFQIVTDPYQAREVINAGKMAVVLEIEVSEPFGCHGWATSSCTAAQVDQQLDDLYKQRRALVAAAQQVRQPADRRALRQRRDRRAHQRRRTCSARAASGTRRRARARCTTTRSITAAPGQLAPLTGTLASLGVTLPALPVYPPAPHCNTRGLTDLGAHTVERMMDKHMIVNPDHMSQAGVDATLEAARGAQLLRRDLAARLDGPGQLAADLEARRRRLPRALRRRPST